MNEQANGSTMYERISEVAELNRVAGFDPLKFARRVVQDGAERLQLDLKYKKLWFRLKYPQGRIKVTPLKITEQLAIIEAKVFFDRKDAAPTASFIAQRYAKDTPGGLYIESAQYAAADTALNDAGFGLQFVDTGSLAAERLQTKKEPVEVPLAAAEPVAPASQEQRLTQPDAPSRPAQEEPALAAPAAVEQSLAHGVQEQTVEQPAAAEPIASAPVAEDMPQEEAAAVVSAAEETAEDAEQPQPGANASAIEEEATAGEVFAAEEASEAEPARYTADMPVDDICALMTYEEARNIIVDVGTCKGWTLAQVADRRAASLKWYLNGYQGDNNVLKAGAKLMLESLTMDRAS